MMCPLKGVGSALCRLVVGCRQGLALRQFRASLPSLCHKSPCGFVLRTGGKFSHEFALSGVFQKLLREINRHLFATWKRKARNLMAPGLSAESSHQMIRRCWLRSERTVFPASDEPYSRTARAMMNMSLKIGNVGRRTPKNCFSGAARAVAPRFRGPRRPPRQQR